MTAPDEPTRTYPELERLERTAVMYAWWMLYLGIGVGFVLGWIMCSLRSCEPQRERFAPRPVAPAPHSLRSPSFRDRALTPVAVPTWRLGFWSSDG